jgi:hypothetical protein
MPCTNHGPKCNGEECANKNLDNGLMTRIWGPSGWLFLHCISFGFPYKIDPTNPEHLEKQNDYYRFFYYLGKVLPCKYCRDSYMDFFTKLSPMSHLGTRKEITKWLYDIHNLVNDKLGVSTCDIPSFEKVEENYQSFRAACKPLTDVQKKDKSSKGCIAPQDGKPKRSVIKVVEYDKIPEPTPTANSTTTTPTPTPFPKSDDYIIISKTTLYNISLTIFILLVVCIIYYICSGNTKKTKLNK